MGIYTRAGDLGETSLADGTRVLKNEPRVEAYGAVDEASSCIGLALAASIDARVSDMLLFAQQRLFNCSSHLATPRHKRTESTPRVSADDVSYLERAIDVFESIAPPLTEFLLPSGSEAVARLHVARAVVRRAERRVVALDLILDGDELVAHFLNRLSDALFAAARATAALQGTPETVWDAQAAPPGL